MEGALVLVLMAATAFGYREDIRIGVLLRPEGDEANELIADRVLQEHVQLVKERLEGETDFHYHKAACRLLRSGCCEAVLSPSCRRLPGQPALACTGAPSEAPDDPSLPRPLEEVAGMRPDTTRATLDLLRDLGWQQILYLHDHPHGPEKLQMMFRVGYSALRLRLAGLLRVTTAREGAELLLQLEQPQRVLLDVAPQLAQELLTRMVHAGRAQHAFLLMQPSLPSFWSYPELRALDVVGFSLLRFDTPLRPFMEGEERTKLFGQPTAFEHRDLREEDYYFHDAALFLLATVDAWRAQGKRPSPDAPADALPPECAPLGAPPDRRLADLFRKVSVAESASLIGRQFSSGEKGRRTNVTLTVLRTSGAGTQTYGWWSDSGTMGGIRRNAPTLHEGALPQIQEKRVLRITTRLSAPFMMVENGTEGFAGFCADLASALCAALQPVQCHVYAAPDGLSGHYDPHAGTWDGMVGEIVRGRADLAVAELAATGARQRAVDFLEPFLVTTLSLVVARPSPRGPPLSLGAWGCAAGAALLVGLALHALGRLSGPPDSIEASSAIWERKLTPLMSAWLVLGSASLQPTGVYPRSLSSRVLAGSWWVFTGLFACMLIASMATQLQLPADNSPQLKQLEALSLEAILNEALENGWPEIGVVSPSYTEDVIRESSVPLLARLRGRVRRVGSDAEGAALAQEGGFALLTESPAADRAASRRPCRLVAVHGTALHGALAVALSPRMEPQLKASVREAFESLHASGFLGHLHRKWWIEQSQCNGQVSPPVLHPSSPLLAALGAGLLLLLVAFAVQFSRRIHTKESRRQQLTFEDINFDQRLPTPPPELLAQPPPVLEVPEIEGRTEASFKDFFDRMRAPSS